MVFKIEYIRKTEICLAYEFANSMEAALEEFLDDNPDVDTVVSIKQVGE